MLDNYKINNRTKYLLFCSFHILLEFFQCKLNSFKFLKLYRKLSKKNSAATVTISGAACRSLIGSPWLLSHSMSLTVSGAAASAQATKLVSISSVKPLPQKFQISQPQPLFQPQILRYPQPRQSKFNLIIVTLSFSQQKRQPKHSIRPQLPSAEAVTYLALRRSRTSENP